jgi:hypothetical protein
LRRAALKLESSELPHQATESVRIRDGRLGSPSKHAQGVGGKNESSTPRRSNAGGSFRGEKPRHPKADHTERTVGLLWKPTECDDVMMR